MIDLDAPSISLDSLPTNDYKRNDHICVAMLPIGFPIKASIVSTTNNESVSHKRLCTSVPWHGCPDDMN